MNIKLIVGLLFGSLFLTSCNSSSSEETANNLKEDTKLNVLLKIHAKDPEAVKKGCPKGSGNFSDLGSGPEVLDQSDGTPVKIMSKDSKTLQASHIRSASFGKQGTNRQIRLYEPEGPGDSDTCIYDVEFGVGPATDQNNKDFRIPFTAPIASYEFYVQIGKRSPILVKGAMLKMQPRLAGYEDYPDWWDLDIFLSLEDDNGGFEIPPTIYELIEP